MNNNKIYNIIRVSDLDAAAELQKLVFFGYDPTKVIEEQSVQIPYSLIQNVFDGKQNKLEAGNLVTLTPNSADNTEKIDIQSDPKKQNTLVNTDGTITLTELSDGTTEIKAITGGEDSMQEDTEAGTKTIKTTSGIVLIKTDASTAYTGIDSALRTISFVNLSKLSVRFALTETNSATSLIKTHVANEINLPPFGSIKFLKTLDGWVMIDLYGLSYLPDKANEARDGKHGLIVSKDGTTLLEKIGEYEVINMNIETAQTSANLNTLYPNAINGFSVVCPKLKKLYKKMSPQVGWVELTYNQV